MRHDFKYIDFIDDTEPNNEQHGSKGKNLIILYKKGIKIPLGFIVKTNAFKETLQDLNLNRRITQVLSNNTEVENLKSLSNNLKSLIYHTRIPKILSDEIKSGISILKHKLGSKISFAVRSSALIEDQPHFSFAGQAESYCCLESFDEILQSVKKVWSSLFSIQALLYLIQMTKHGTNFPEFEMAIIIQHMIISERAGVLFTNNVISNNPNQMLINSNWGLCESVTNNSVIPDMIILNKNKFEIHKMSIGNKQNRIIKNPNGASTIVIENELKLRDSLSLNNDYLQKLYKLGNSTEKIFKCPQDVEWAIKDNEIYVLQSRPITTLNSN